MSNCYAEFRLKNNASPKRLFSFKSRRQTGALVRWRRDVGSVQSVVEGGEKSKATRVDHPSLFLFLNSSFRLFSSSFRACAHTHIQYILYSYTDKHCPPSLLNRRLLPRSLFPHCHNVKFWPIHHTLGYIYSSFFPTILCSLLFSISPAALSLYICIYIYIFTYIVRSLFYNICLSNRVFSLLGISDYVFK